MSGYSKGAGSLKRKNKKKGKVCEKKESVPSVARTGNYLMSDEYLWWLFDFTESEGEFTVPDVYSKETDTESTINLPMLPSFVRMIGETFGKSEVGYVLELKSRIIYVSLDKESSRRYIFSADGRYFEGKIKFKRVKLR